LYELICFKGIFLPKLKEKRCRNKLVKNKIIFSLGRQVSGCGPGFEGGLDIGLGQAGFIEAINLKILLNKGIFWPAAPLRLPSAA
jgi:hypothetical protein